MPRKQTKPIRYKITTPSGRIFYMYGKNVEEITKRFKAAKPEQFGFQVVPDDEPWKTHLQDGRVAPGA